MTFLKGGYLQQLLLGIRPRSAMKESVYFDSYLSPQFSRAPGSHTTNLFVQARAFGSTDLTYLYYVLSRRCSEDHGRIRNVEPQSIPLGHCLPITVLNQMIVYIFYYEKKLSRTVCLGQKINTKECSQMWEKQTKNQKCNNMKSREASKVEISVTCIFLPKSTKIVHSFAKSIVKTLWGLMLFWS